MAFDANGTHSRVHNWSDDAAGGVNITASRFDAENDDFSTALTATVKKSVDDVLSAGYAETVADDGTKTSGTYTPAYTGGNLKKIVNGGAFTLAAPSTDGTIVIQVTNNASAGAITFSGFTVGSSTGDSLTTTDGDDFFITITRINGFIAYQVLALQ